MIVGNNTILNQYVPTFFIKDLSDGQSLIYDSVRKAFTNTSLVVDSGGAIRLGQLLDVSSSVDNPLSLQNGQALIYNSFSKLWQNTFVDYNTLLNKPISLGTVTSVSVTTANGVSGSVATATTTPAISLTLGAITPTSVTSIGAISGSNLSGTNTGDQLITLTGDVTGSGTGSFATTLATVPIAKGGTGHTTSTTAFNALAPSQAGHGGEFLTTDGTSISWAYVAGAGSVTTVSVTDTSDITGTVTSPTLAPDISMNLTTTGVSANTYGSSTQIPVFTVDSKGRISSVVNTAISGGGLQKATEVVVFRYSSGGSGNFTAVDAIHSQTSGVTATIVDGINCIATYSFTGKVTPPISITIYGQNFVTNTFSITGVPGPNAASANIKIAGGGTSASPDIVNGTFSSSNVVTLQTTMANTGASSTVGNRAWLVVIFGF